MFNLFYFFLLFFSISVSGFNLLNNINFGNFTTNLTEIVPSIQNNRVVLLGNISIPKYNFKTNTSLYGGIPQNCNYTELNQSIYVELQSKNISSNFSDFLVYDFESWTPVWDTINNYYKNESINYTKTLFPNLDNETTYIRSKEFWEEDAMELLIYIVNTARNLYPNASIGYYGYPGMPYWGSEEDYKRASLNNDLLFELWNEVDVLLPSIYIPYISNRNLNVYLNNLHYVRRKIDESIRIKNILNRSELTIYPYTWHRYHDPYDKYFLNYSDMRLEYEYPSTFSEVDGVILWSSENNEQRMNDTVNWFIKHKRFLDNL